MCRAGARRRRSRRRRPAGAAADVLPAGWDDRPGSLRHQLRRPRRRPGRARLRLRRPELQRPHGDRLDHPELPRGPDRRAGLRRPRRAGAQRPAGRRRRLQLGPDRLQLRQPRHPRPRRRPAVRVRAPRGQEHRRQEGAVGRRRHPDRADGLERQLELAPSPLHRSPELRALRALCRRMRHDGRMGGAARDPGRGLGRRRRAEREGVRREGRPPVRRGRSDRHVRPRHPLRQRPGRGAQPRRGGGGQAVDPAAGRQRRLLRGALGLGLSLRLGEAAAEAEPRPARALEPHVRARRAARRRQRRSTSSRRRSRSSTGRRTPSRRRSSPRPRAPARSSSAGSRPRS